MESTDLPLRPPAGDGPPPGHGPWWLRAGARLTVLLLILAAVGVYALMPGGEERADFAGWCARPAGPPSLLLPLGELRGLVSAGGLASLAGTGRDEEQGFDGPSVAWTDRPPTAATFAPAGAGYELRWSRRGGAEMVDVFAFPSAADAAYYAAQAGSTACRESARSRPLSAPRAARAVTWINPQGKWQSDVFFARRRVVYRVSVVGSPATDGGGTLPRPADLSAQVIACRLATAGCAY